MNQDDNPGNDHSRIVKMKLQKLYQASQDETSRRLLLQPTFQNESIGYYKIENLLWTK